jgi:hypothetical protein
MIADRGGQSFTTVLEKADSDMPFEEIRRSFLLPLGD